MYEKGGGTRPCLSGILFELPVDVFGIIMLRLRSSIECKFLYASEYANVCAAFLSSSARAAPLDDPGGMNGTRRLNDGSLFIRSICCARFP